MCVHLYVLVRITTIKKWMTSYRFIESPLIRLVFTEIWTARAAVLTWSDCTVKPTLYVWMLLLSTALVRDAGFSDTTAHTALHKSQLQPRVHPVSWLWVTLGSVYYQWPIVVVCSGLHVYVSSEAAIIRASWWSKCFYYWTIKSNPWFILIRMMFFGLNLFCD